MLSPTSGELCDAVITVSCFWPVTRGTRALHMDLTWALNAEDRSVTSSGGAVVVDGTGFPSLSTRGEWLGVLLLKPVKI